MTTTAATPYPARTDRGGRGSGCRPFHCSTVSHRRFTFELLRARAFPVDTLKIDKTFIRDIAEDEDDRSICSAIVALGQALRLHVLAEGVEHQEQAEILKHQGCHLVQGFLYARPMPAQDVWSWLTAESTAVD